MQLLADNMAVANKINLHVFFIPSVILQVGVRRLWQGKVQVGQQQSHKGSSHCCGVCSLSLFPPD